jgi:Uma2 family endonuclease
MPTLAPSPPILSRYRFSIADYRRMAELGFFPQGARIELLNGEIVEMSPINSKHASMVDRLAELLVLQLHGRALIKVQNPIALDELSEPEPDLAIVRRRDDFYKNAHPSPQDILFLIEVSDTSLAKDRQVKLPLYAAAGVAETWIVDLEGEQVEVYTEPGPDGYARTRAYRKGEKIAVLGLEWSVEF